MWVVTERNYFYLNHFFFTDKINLCFVTKLKLILLSFFFCSDDDDDDCTGLFFFLAVIIAAVVIYACIWVNQMCGWENVFPINKFKKFCLLNKT